LKIEDILKKLLIRLFPAAFPHRGALLTLNIAGAGYGR